MSKFKFKYRVTGIAELSKTVAVVIPKGQPGVPGGMKGETVSTCLWEFDEIIEYDKFLTDDFTPILDKVKSPYEGYLITDKAKDLTVKYEVRYVPEQPNNSPIKD